MRLSPAEIFLAGFHDADPGGTTRAFGAIPAWMAGTAFASSYECLASAVPPGATSVVDLACGDGYLLSLLRARAPGLALAGVDLSAGELEAARRRLGPAAILHQARAQALPLPDGCADAVLCHMALMLMDDAPRVLAEVRRILQPRGVFAAVVGGGAGVGQAREVFVGLLRQYRRLPEFESLRLGDRRLYAADGIAELFQPGFEAPAVDAIELRMRCGPAALWGRFGGMYDLGWLGPADRVEIERRFIEAVTPLCGADGRMDHSEQLRRITAVRSDEDDGDPQCR